MSDDKPSKRGWARWTAEERELAVRLWRHGATAKIILKELPRHTEKSIYAELYRQGCTKSATKREQHDWRNLTVMLTRNQVEQLEELARERKVNKSLLVRRYFPRILSMIKNDDKKQ